MENDKIEKHLDDLIAIEKRYYETYERNKWYFSQLNSEERIDVLTHLKELVKK